MLKVCKNHNLKERIDICNTNHSMNVTKEKKVCEPVKNYKSNILY